MAGKIVSINISNKKHISKIPDKEGVFIENYGLEGDSHAGNDTHRQVSLLAVESIKKMGDIIIGGLSYGDFAENITTEGIILHKIPVGTKVRIGNTVHEVTQIGKECHNECAIKQEYGECIMPTEGIFTRVLKGGKVREGDIIEIINGDHC